MRRARIISVGHGNQAILKASSRPQEGPFTRLGSGSLLSRRRGNKTRGVTLLLLSELDRVFRLTEERSAPVSACLDSLDQHCVNPQCQREAQPWVNECEAALLPRQLLPTACFGACAPILPADWTRGELSLPASCFPSLGNPL